MTPDKKAPRRKTTLELVADDGARLVSLTSGLTLYTDRVLSEIPDQVLAVYEKFLVRCPPEALRYYATENMRRHKPVTKSVFRMLPTWLAPGAPPREYVHIEMKDGEQHQDAPAHKLDVYGLEPKSSLFGRGRANLVSMAFPAEWAQEEPEEFREFVVGLAETFPFVSGHAGFAFEVSRYESEESQTFAWAKSMRHRGIDIARPPLDAIAVGHDAVKGVGWLTLVSRALLEKLGGQAKIRRALPADVKTTEVSRGVVLQAGPAPELGDTNRKDLLPLYREVYRVVAPLVQIAASRSPSLDIEEDYVEKTRKWFARFADA
jgi:hypothetical protein